MFDIGFSEIVVIGVVALVVIGPERLPKTARTLGHLFGRLQRYVNDVKADINREMELEELRSLREQVKSAASDLQQTMSSAASDVQAGVRSVEQQLNDAGRDSPAAPAPAAPAAVAPGDPPPTLATFGEPLTEPEPARQPTLPGFEKI
jgi:sec-independent protein translocase protein TatB